MSAAVVIPFPRARDRRFVFKQARYAATLTTRGCDEHVHRQVRLQIETMIRRGVDPARAQAEGRQLKAAIRTTLWHLVLRDEPGGAA